MVQNQHAATPHEDPWANPASIIQAHIAHLTRRANTHSDRVTAGGDRDMNAALVEATRATDNLSMVIELNGLLNEVRAAQESLNQERERHNAELAKRAYEQGIVDGLGKATESQDRDRVHAADKLAFGNPAADRNGEDMIVPRGYTAAWYHEYHEPSGERFYREVYGKLDADVREGDTRAVIVAGQDKHLISLDRVRFAPSLHELVAQADLKTLESVEVRPQDPGTVRLLDGMDGEGWLDAHVHTLKPADAASTAKPGTYIRLHVNQQGVANVTLDLTRAQWENLEQAVTVLFARHLIAQAEGDES